MIFRNFPVQWLLVIILVVIILFFKIKLELLKDENKMLISELTKIQDFTKNQKNSKSDTLEKFEDTIIIYNRVPKTGSTSFVGVVYDLCKKNKFHTLHINITNNMHTFTLYNQTHVKFYNSSYVNRNILIQIQFVNNITRWNIMKPAFYHGHMAFLNFNKFGVKQVPLYLNLLRKPLDRFISYYYFLRYGDNFRPHLLRKKYGDTKTFDECVKAGQTDCDPNSMWLQIPFLCGHEPGCWEVGNRWALEEAKRNLANNYFLVGVTEELDEFVRILQIVLPDFFRGAHDLFSHSDKSHLRKTSQKIKPLPETVKIIQNSTVWKMENELYNFAVSYFHSVKKRLINASLQDLNQHFMYEKIRPK